MSRAASLTTCTCSSPGLRSSESWVRACSVAPGSRRIDPLPICVKPASRHGKFVYDCKDRIVCSVVVFGAGIAMIT
jgi:hypothetical protein